MHTLAAVCLAGCEDVVVVDILSFLKDKHHDVSATCSVLSYSSIQTEASAEINGKKLYRGDTGCGKIIVTTIISPSVIVNAIRSVQYWFAYLSFSDKLPISTKKTGTEKTHDDELNHVTDLLRDADWTTALKTWSEFTGLDPEAKNITFCGRAIRNGTHSFSSQDIAMKIGEGVLTKQPHWKVNLTEMVSEIIAVVLNETLLLGIHLRHPDHKAFAKSKFPTEVRKPVLSLTSSSSGSMSPSLRPSSAYVILSLLEARPNELMVDATCSFGTCLVEASYGYGCVAIGGDCDIGLTEQQRNNAKSSMETARCHGHRIPAMMEILLWGASHLPIRDAIVDLLFVEIPWSKSKSDRPKYCNRMKIPKIAEEVARILCPSTGRCCWLIQAHHHLVSVLDSIYFCSTVVRGINLGGFVVSLVIAKRTSLPFVEPKRGTDTWDKHRLSWYDETKDSYEKKDSTSSKRQKIEYICWYDMIPE